jgi:hypothetical protein
MGTNRAYHYFQIVVPMSIQNFSWIIPDKLAGSAMPGKSMQPEDSLMLTDCRDLFMRGIRCLLSLKEMPDSFGGLCKNAGLEWVSFPIPDFGIPEDIEAFTSMVTRALSIIHSGKPLCVHCYAGIGRTGITLSCILGVYYSLDGISAVEQVRNRRVALETRAQVIFVAEFLSRYSGNVKAGK